VLRAAARLNLPISWIPERLSEQNFNLEEPPTKASPWVGVLLNHLRVFRRSLESLGTMTPRDTDQVRLLSCKGVCFRSQAACYKLSLDAGVSHVWCGKEAGGGGRGEAWSSIRRLCRRC